MAVAPAKAAQPGGLNIKELLSNLDVDGDGDIDENDKAIAEALKSMDMDGDGTISIRELIKIGEVRVRNEKRIKNLTYAVFALCGLFVVFCAVMMALVVAANEATKDTRPSGDGTMKTVDGKVVSTESKKYPLILADLPRYPFEVIESLDALRVRKTGTQETYYYTVTGYSWFSKYSMQLHTARHDIISINGAGEGKPVAVTVISGEADGASFSVELAPEKTAAARRRLMQAPAPSPALAADLVEDQGGNGATGTQTGIVDTTDNVPATADTAPLASDTEPDQVTVEKWDTYYRMDMVFNYGTCILGAPDTVMGTEATMTYEKDVLDHFGELEVAEGVTAAVGMKETKAKIDAVLASKSKVENPGKRLFTKMQVDFVECCASILPWPYPMGNVVPISKWPPVEKADTDNTEYNPTDIASLYGACYTKYNNAAKAAGKPQIKVAECASADATLFDATCMTIQIGGCMNKDAKNYNASATFDDATCVMPRVGCKAVLALNYDATLDAKDKNDPTKCVMPVPGCMDAAATNFVPLANKDPLLKIDDKVVDWKYEKNGDAGVMMMSPTMAGIKAQYDTRLITDSNNKPNSKPQVGSCMYNVKVWGCWDKMSTMYNPAATDHDYEMCEPMKEMVTGCMGVAAFNYNVNATMESGLCTCEDDFTPTYEYPPATYTDAKNAAEYNAQVYGPMEPTFSCVATPPPPVVPAVAPAPAPAPTARHLLAATTTAKANDGDVCVASADCKSDMCNAGVCVAQSTGSGLLAATITNPNLAATAGNDGVAKAAELISTTAHAVNGPAAASVAYVPCRSTVYFNIDMSSTLAQADYDAVMTAVTAAAAVGGGVLFVTGGLAAPAVVASLASMGAAGGILGTAALSMGTLLAYFGGAGGISMIFGGVGAGLTGWRMLNRTSGLSQFAFLPVRGTGAGMSVYLFVPGFLRDPADLFRTWGATDGVYSVMLKLPKRSDVNGHLDDDDDVKGSLVAGLGMWLKRDVDTREVFVSWIDPGGVADRAGVAEGSVLTALATRVDAPDSSPDDPSDGTDTETSRQQIGRAHV